MVNGQETTKARPCARGFQELQDFRTDLPTCSRESVCIATLNSIDVKTAFCRENLLKKLQCSSTHHRKLRQIKFGDYISVFKVLQMHIDNGIYV